MEKALWAIFFAVLFIGWAIGKTLEKIHATLSELRQDRDPTSEDGQGLLFQVTEIKKALRVMGNKMGGGPDL
jgi:hypothetical protein